MVPDGRIHEKLLVLQVNAGASKRRIGPQLLPWAGDVSARRVAVCGPDEVPALRGLARRGRRSKAFKLLGLDP